MQADVENPLSKEVLTNESTIVLTYGMSLVNELASLALNQQQFDMIIVDATHTGFLFQTEVFLRAALLSERLLTLGGNLVFVKPNGAVAIQRESHFGGLSLRVFESLNELYDYSPSLALMAHKVLELPIEVEPTDLSQQILMSSVPVLTFTGIKMKAEPTPGHKRNRVLAAIDNYTTIGAIIQALSTQSGLSSQEILSELQTLEKLLAIFPVFTKVSFLSSCYRNQATFTLIDLLLASKTITREQLDELRVSPQGTFDKLELGAECVARKLISARQLEVLMHDLAFYGRIAPERKLTSVSTTTEPEQGQSLVGQLGTTDPSGLLQNLATNRETGVLSVEHDDLQFRAFWDAGRLTHARLGALKGTVAVMEFACVWREGIFVFMHRQPSSELVHDSCKVSKPLDKTLLDAALARDNLERVYNQLPNGSNTLLEKTPQQESTFATEIIDLATGKPVAERVVQIMYKLWQGLDGLTPVTDVFKTLGDVTTYEAVTALDQLLSLALVAVAQTDIFGPFDKFQKMVKAISEKITLERNIALLRLSLQGTHGYSATARMFTLGQEGEVGIDLAAARLSGITLSVIAKALDDWQVKYIEYIAHEIDRKELRAMIRMIYRQQ